MRKTATKKPQPKLKSISTSIRIDEQEQLKHIKELQEHFNVGTSAKALKRAAFMYLGKHREVEYLNKRLDECSSKLIELNEHIEKFKFYLNKIIK